MQAILIKKLETNLLENKNHIFNKFKIVLTFRNF